MNTRLEENLMLTEESQISTRVTRLGEMLTQEPQIHETWRDTRVSDLDMRLEVMPTADLDSEKLQNRKAVALSIPKLDLEWGPRPPIL